MRLPDINFEKKTADNAPDLMNENTERKRERKVFQALCDTYQNIVYEAENKIFAQNVKVPTRRQKLKVTFDKDKGFCIQMANSMEEK